MLAADGIRNTAQLAAFTTKHGRRGECRYDVLVRLYGERNADRIMRLVEIAEWDI
jgi:hypothetical protein